MTVKELMEDLTKAPPDSEVAFEGNGMWPVSGIEIGRVLGQKIGYVLLHSAGKSGVHHLVRHRKLGNNGR